MRIPPLYMVWTALAAISAAALNAEVAAPVVESPLVERFLNSNGTTLFSYRASRTLTASSRSGRMTANLTAMTSLDPDAGFVFQVVAEQGSGLIRSRVLHRALQAEQDALAGGELTRSALTSENYVFGAGEPEAFGLMRIAITPRRREAMLVSGHVFVTTNDVDLVRVEGLLVKGPSWWTRRVEVVRRYARVAGVRVPVEMTSTADVLIGGRSTFSMTYQYESINGEPIAAAAVAHETHRIDHAGFPNFHRSYTTVTRPPDTVPDRPTARTRTAPRGALQ
jgi:hypothetical protein